MPNGLQGCAAGALHACVCTARAAWYAVQRGIPFVMVSKRHNIPRGVVSDSRGNRARACARSSSIDVQRFLCVMSRRALIACRRCGTTAGPAPLAVPKRRRLCRCHRFGGRNGYTDACHVLWCMRNRAARHVIPTAGHWLVCALAHSVAHGMRTMMNLSTRGNFSTFELASDLMLSSSLITLRR